MLDIDDDLDLEKVPSNLSVIYSGLVLGIRNCFFFGGWHIDRRKRER